MKTRKSFPQVAKTEIARNFAHEYLDRRDERWAELESDNAPFWWGLHELFLLDQAIRLVFTGEFYHERLATRVRENLERCIAYVPGCLHEDVPGAVRLAKLLLAKIRNIQKNAERKNRK